MKLSPWTIYIIGISFSTIPVAFAYFHGFKPMSDEAASYESVIEDLKRVAEQYPQAKKKVDQAIAKGNEAAQNWRFYASTRTPPTNVRSGGVDLSVNAWQLSVDTRRFRNSMQVAVNNQVRRGGVKVLTAPYVNGIAEDAPVGTILTSFYNFPQPYAFPVVIRDLGQVQVQGTYNQIMANVRSWANMPHYLAVADGLRLDGTSPTLTGTYNVTIVGFIRANQVFPTVPELASANAGGAGGGRGMTGGPPGMPGGMGGPPMGMGGSGMGRPGGMTPSFSGSSGVGGGGGR